MAARFTPLAGALPTHDGNLLDWLEPFQDGNLEGGWFLADWDGQYGWTYVCCELYQP